MASVSDRACILDVGLLRELFDSLQADDYQIIGPKMREGTIQLVPLVTFEELPVGYVDEQIPGSYQVVDAGNGTYFGFHSPIQSFKKYLHPPRRKLWEGQRTQDGFQLSSDQSDEAKKVFWGIRACDLTAIGILDRVLMRGKVTNHYYEARRSSTFVLAVSCTSAGSTCFCNTMDSGPAPRGGYDLCLTEVKTAEEHYFLAESGSEAGSTLLERIQARRATSAQEEKARKQLAAFEVEMGSRFDPSLVGQLLKQEYRNPHWESVANRCLSCANCTLVCPTCFCTNVEDVNDITGEHAERWLQWDSCFNNDFKIGRAHV